jgi:hypothetical protein
LSALPRRAFFEDVQRGVEIRLDVDLALHQTEPDLGRPVVVQRHQLGQRRAGSGDDKAFPSARPIDDLGEQDLGRGDVDRRHEASRHVFR